MWPWMRDLPTSVWAGRGWAFDENGLRRLSSSGGSHAMQGVEVFESVGVAAEEVKLSDEKIEEEAPIAVAAAENPLPTCGEQKPNKFTRNNVAKQSGVPNVGWNNTMQSWCVCFYEQDAKGKKIRRTSRRFSLKHFMGPGISEAQADAAALEAAKAFRAELVEKGILSEPKPKDPNFTSEVPGVRWKKLQRKWQCIDPSRKGQEHHFTAAPSPRRLRPRPRPWSSSEKARPAAPGEARGHPGKQIRRDCRCSTPRCHYPGVYWNQGEQQWHACCNVGGAQSTFQGEAQGPLGGGAGALLPSGCGMEEEAGEGESEGEGERL